VVELLYPTPIAPLPTFGGACFGSKVLIRLHSAVHNFMPQLNLHKTNSHINFVPLAWSDLENGASLDLIINTVNVSRTAYYYPAHMQRGYVFGRGVNIHNIDSILDIFTVVVSYYCGFATREITDDIKRLLSHALMRMLMTIAHARSV
jgi:hypothetical protein